MEMAHAARFSGPKEAVTVNEKLLYITYPCLQRVKASAEVKKELQRQLAEWIKEDETVKEMLIMTQDYIKKNSITEQEAVVMVSRNISNFVYTWQQPKKFMIMLCVGLNHKCRKT